MSVKAIEAALATARGEIGMLEKQSNSELYDKTANAGSNNYTKYAYEFDTKYPDFYNGIKNGFPWCDISYDWIMVVTFGVENAKKLLCQPDRSCGAGCSFSAGYYRANGQFYTRDCCPQRGDQIFFGEIYAESHTGMVEDYDDSFVYTIEGNATDNGDIPNGGAVCRKQYPRGYGYISGYGRPDWSIVAYMFDDAGTVEADDREYTAGLDNEDTIKSFLREAMGLSMAQTAGILANIKWESDFQTGSIGDNGTSYGICQWHLDRWSRLKSWCAENGKDDTTLDGQLWYFKYELTECYKVSTWNKIAALTAEDENTAYQVAAIFCENFERPANLEANKNNRGNLARQYFRSMYGASSEITDGDSGRITVELYELSFGDVGEQVRAMQILIGGRGGYLGAAGCDGEFGPATRQAVKTFQRGAGISIDGICGKETWSKLLAC